MIRQLSLAAAISALLALAAPPARAGTIQVPADRPTIQLALDAAVAGDTVLVAPGEYAGPENQNLDFHGRDLVLSNRMVSAGPSARPPAAALGQAVVSLSDVDRHLRLHVRCCRPSPHPFLA